MNEIDSIVNSILCSKCRMMNEATEGQTGDFELHPEFAEIVREQIMECVKKCSSDEEILEFKQWLLSEISDHVCENLEWTELGCVWTSRYGDEPDEYEYEHAIEADVKLYTILFYYTDKDGQEQNEELDFVDAVKRMQELIKSGITDITIDDTFIVNYEVLRTDTEVSKVGRGW